MRFDLEDDSFREHDRIVAKLANDTLDTISSNIWEKPYVEMPERPTAAFMFVVLRQVFLHRLLELGEAVVRECHASRWALMATAARSVIETSALLHRLIRRLTTKLDEKDREAFQKLVYQTFFATRDKKAIEQGIGETAVNILTAVDEFEKSVPGLRNCYDKASEIAHPNAAGLLYLYTRADVEEKRMRIGAASTFRLEIFGHVYFSMVALSTSFIAMEEVAQRVSEIVALDDE